MPPLGHALRVLALVPMITGAASAVAGAAIIPDAGAVSASVESELRFFSVWWVGLGLYLWSLAPRVHERGRELRVACALLFAGGLARLWAIADAGRPATTFVVLMAIELVIAPLLVLWQSRIGSP
ncbi:MAG: hypothetical protein QOD86_2412 [Miltoncostaeaceae bacterium]|jgi:hypothetical protein|nr:hypothetical protein [Miltoncostaeaceae bacterium]